eukprot:TRINITY_DN6219_c0_g1_i2.p1 TRINITY_DN6219_c0_g1~~TRINITY_DN6219_c0_g1_i2.p1  ORF type:complete len:242 (-),score=2.64 TRINITY_DN6219_c0_g1_i2:256-981(-)
MIPVAFLSTYPYMVSLPPVSSSPAVPLLKKLSDCPYVENHSLKLLTAGSVVSFFPMSDLLMDSFSDWSKFRRGLDSCLILAASVVQSHSGCTYPDPHPRLTRMHLSPLVLWRFSVTPQMLIYICPWLGVLGLGSSQRLIFGLDGVDRILWVVHRQPRDFIRGKQILKQTKYTDIPSVSPVQDKSASVMTKSAQPTKCHDKVSVPTFPSISLSSAWVLSVTRSFLWRSSILKVTASFCLTLQ